jgi:hypothetical protein
MQCKVVGVVLVVIIMRVFGGIGKRRPRSPRLICCRGFFDRRTPQLKRRENCNDAILIIAHDLLILLLTKLCR